MGADPGPPRGVLHQRLEQGTFEHARRAPSAALAMLVEHYWYVAWDLRGLPAQQQETLPHPNVHYVIEPGLTAIYGVHSGRYVRMLEGQRRVFGIKFRAGGFRPFYGKAVSTLMDSSMDASTIFGAPASRFEQTILASDSFDAMIDAAETLLLARLPPHDATVAQVSALVADIATDRSITSVEEIAARSGLGKRSLQRLFNEYVGVSPKWVINRYRLHEAVAQLQAGTPIVWSELALQLGYFDQAHFIRDFRKLIGRAPGDYARSQDRH
ncbi:helix-turn-helix domain-containing protein [Dyella acidiphila]|uniref:Helix-turn-helix transcriptional regulator n=1 Tax=Dyella acidiphila TaxID=2775866 RepID=A0ABR9G8K1_9GAMM|nr:AraC family transcriptional regulator [Dyella acidiphila]MBE1160383.1 helix-turn-helix transcriptional regulator [Dyella acidiphila]